MTVINTLQKARDLIALPDRWTQGAYAVRDDVLHLDFVAFCSLGAISMAATGDPYYNNGEALDAREVLAAQLPERFLSISSFNDHWGTTHQDVLDLFDHAIEAERNRL